MKPCHKRFLDGAKKVLLVGALMTLGSLANAVEKTVVGLITMIAVGNDGDPASPVIGISIKPALQECFYGIMVVPNSGAGYGKMITSAAIAAQAGNNSVSITYDNSDGCRIKQFVVLTP
ncbi:hypothetical protein [Zestomonas carbonaria]|nr:hypothetical protein [Pseudomonas carbonaria]